MATSSQSPSFPQELHAPILIVGSGTGGVAAGLAAAALGSRVILTEETDWIGGQLTSQAVPPDENAWIESFGCTRRYRAFRDGVRQYYRDHYPLTPAARATRNLNPGGGSVSRLCHEPKVALAVMQAMLAPHESAGRVRVMLNKKPVAAHADGDRVRSVTVVDVHTGARTTITADYVLDATELGDVLPLAGVEYVTGAESKRETGELHAVDGPAQPGNVQAITWCFPLAWDPTSGANHTIDRPAHWERWRDYVPQVNPAWPGKLLSWTDLRPITLSLRHNYLREEHFTEKQRGGSQFFRYRQIVKADHFDPTLGAHDVTLVNWPMNDYMEGNLIDASPAEYDRAMREAKELSRCLVYWLQTEAENPKTGGRGYPNLYPRPDIAGTDDGFAKFPYVRESRRIKAVFTVLEQHVGTEARYGVNPDYAEAHAMRDNDMRSEPFADSVGIGHYRIDLHISTGGNNYIDISSLPFQIPLGALIPQRVENLLPACKNVGVTHITNGCYRLHPVEWNIGESAGILAAFCMAKNVRPRAVRERKDLLEEFQKLLSDQGVELSWPRTHPG
jgi:hypothetical protein